MKNRSPASVFAVLLILWVVGNLSRVHAANHMPVGGGTTKAGLDGEYFANPNFEGEPSFARRDVRINFDWKEGVAGKGLPVGGATTPGMHDFPHDDFSIRWTGAVVPRFSETYTFRVTGKDGVRFTLGSKVLVDRLRKGGVHEVKVPMRKGEPVDLVFEYVDRAGTGASEAKLEWSGPSTPLEVIEPLSFAQACLHLAKPGTWKGFETADMVRTGSTGLWSGADRRQLTQPLCDENGWPKVGECTIGLSQYGARTYEGTYKMIFKGKANVQVNGGMGGTWNTKPDGSGEETRGTLPKGKGYDAATGETTMYFVATVPNHMALQFSDAERAEGEPGLTDLRLYYPTARGSNEPHLPGELYTREARAFFKNFVVLRQHIGTSLNPGRTWDQRTRPSYYSRGDHTHPDRWGYCLEELIMSVNDLGCDLHICCGADWDQNFMKKFAQLVRYGSDGVEPYTEYVENPEYPPLNPNLRIYLEHSNEFPWAVYPHFVWGVLQKKVAENHPDWQIINYDGQCAGADGKAMHRYHGLRTKQISDAFSGVYSDVPGAMGDRFRPLQFGQYASDRMNVILQFLDSYFNKSDPKSTYEGEPIPPSAYLWGGGGAIYYGCSNRFGLMDKEPIPDSGFEESDLADGTAALRSNVTGWTFTGNAGICDVKLARQPAIAGQTLPAEPAKPLPKDQWVGCRFTVGDKDLYVYQLGRYVAQGNRLGHSVAIFAEDGQKLIEVNVNVHTAGPGSYAYAWCGGKAWGNDKVYPLLLEAGKTYYLASSEQRGRAADRFYGSETAVTPIPGVTIKAAVIRADGKEWQETPGSRCIGPVNMICTDQVLTTADGRVGVPPDNSSVNLGGRRGKDFVFGEQCAFLQGDSSMSREFTVEEAGAYWITFNCAMDMVSNGHGKYNWGGWGVSQGGATIRVKVDGKDMTSRLLPIGGHMSAFHVFHYMASTTFRLEPGKHTVIFERVNANGGTAFIDEVHLSSEMAFYGGPDAPNFPAGGHAIGQVESDHGAYYRNARAECDMSRNYGLVPMTYEGGWAVQADFDHYGMLAWNDLRYGSEATNPELTKQALRNAFNIWCEQGGYIYAYFYPVTPDVAKTDTPLLECVREFNSQLAREPVNGTKLPATLTSEGDHYQNNPNNNYIGFNASRKKAGPLMPPHTWKSWIVIAPETADYQVLVDATSGGGFQLDVDGFKVAAGTTGDASVKPAVVRLTKGQHAIKVRNTDGLFFLKSVLVGMAGQALVRSEGGGLAFPEKPADDVIDIRMACNRGIEDNADPGREGGGFAGFGKESCFRGLEPGKTDFSYKLVAFDIVDATKNGGNACVVLSGPTRVDAFPKVSAPIPVGRKAAVLYFLHTALYVKAAQGEAIVRYRMQYEDGSEAVFDCGNRVELGDWWGLPTLKNGLAAYSENNRMLMVTPWKNPHPDKVIKSIVMESTGKAIPALFGVTASDSLAEYEVLKKILE